MNNPKTLDSTGCGQMIQAQGHRRALSLGICLLASFCLALGCAHQQTRLQSEEDADRDKEADVKTIGDVTGVANAEPIRVIGVGLVDGLPGTGGGASRGVSHRSRSRTAQEGYRECEGLSRLSQSVTRSCIRAHSAGCARVIRSILR